VLYSDIARALVKDYWLRVCMWKCLLCNIKPYSVCFSVGIVSSKACPNTICLSQCLWASRSAYSHSLPSLTNVCWCW